MTEHFEIVNNFLGMGEPQNGIWFIGIEEHQEWKESPEGNIGEYAIYKNNYCCCQKDQIKDAAKKNGAKYTKIYDVMSKIICGLRGESLTNIDSWKTYRNEILLQEGSGIFQTNLFPLGKRSIKKWPTHYNKLFGFGKENIKGYREVVERTRFEELRNLWNASVPKATICFGKTHWQDFMKLLGISEGFANQDDGKILVHEGKKIILTPFFSYRYQCFNNERILKVITILKEFKVQYNSPPLCLTTTLAN